jgi:phosphatidylserine/phosphatidylglycerophosphate/cardiolipin synthase-like enzyme
MNYGYRRFRWFHLIIAVIVALVIYGIQAGPGLFRSWHLPTTFAGGNSNAGTLGNNARIEVYFSPKGGCTEACVRELGKATNAVLVQAYEFTSRSIAQALVDAQARGVKVAVILDKSQRTQKGTEADFIANSGIPTSIDAVHPIAHNKIIIIDGAVVITGSFNFTNAAEAYNAENLLVIRDPDLALLYLRNWAEHRKHSQEYQGR